MHIYKHLSSHVGTHVVKPLSMLVVLAAVLGAASRARAQAQPPPGPAESEVDTMTLGQVLEIAVRQRPSLALAAIDVAIADAAVLEAAGVDDWVFDVTTSWLSVRVPGVDPEVGMQNAPTLDLNDRDTIKLAGSLERAFSTGGTLSVGMQSSYTRQSYTYYGEMGVVNEGNYNTYENGLSAQFTQPLLRGRGARIARASQARARLSRDRAVLEHQLQAILAVREVIAAYWELAYALRDLDIRKNSLALARERLRNTEAGIEAGAVAPTEALAVRQSIATREAEILASELTIAQQSLELRRLAGLEIGPGDVYLATDAPLAVTPTGFDVDALLAKAYAQNPRVAALEVQRQDATIDVEVTENGMLPELQAMLSVGPTGSADSLGESLSKMATFDDVTFNASLTYRHTLGNRGARGAHLRARQTLLKQRVQLADVKAQIASSVVLAVKRAEAAHKRIELSKEAIELAEKNIEAEKARFELGRATNFDVLQRQDELKQAQLRRARAIVDYLDAVAAIDALTGDILPKYGVTVDAPADR